MSKRKGTDKGREIMIFRNRARRPNTRPARSGRANRKRQAIQEGSN